MQKGKMVVSGGLTNSCEKKRSKKQRREKKTFLSDQCKEKEENNSMGKTREFFKKIRDIKGRFQAKMGSLKDRNGMDLTEAEDIKKWQEYTEELYKKDLHNPDNHNGVITHLEPDILECEVKWAFSSVQFSSSVVSDSLRPHELQHARPPCPSPTSGVHSNSCPSCQ